MSETTSPRMVDMAERAKVLPLKLHAENKKLKKELIKLYEREEYLLKYISIQDRYLQGTTALKQLPANFVLGTVDLNESDLVSSSEPRALGKDLVDLNNRYDALSKSKLGRLQLWYWRLRAGK
ncbi:hypothetical protein FQ154_14130 [Paeniglutamicibacter gangotriensis]|uniref:Uncharacterized protein n=1 Tax=Paeniglutamicibacter gangotriensis TaxID=254787 RepID=A0A5B0EAL6_9MICC|nr:hypothetical protein [Paeniglutamicibacter gangotriensis]KAA0975332.1 hypothetical protein FQ154_14130 [Paeniglutamicibacter gangotriensis]